MPARKPRLKKPQANEAASPLDHYNAKRNFKRTPEPGGSIEAARGTSFVVQEHHARSHHYDFRLEMDGVLVSWAVPKGIPEDEAAKRLAVHVEDHPLEYGGFEGVIPEGNYGAGTVTIWDQGSWQPLDKDWRKAFQKGKLKFALRGSLLSGGYVLARMGEEPNWLMRKLKDEVVMDALGPAAAESEEAGFVAPQLARVVPSVPAGPEWVHEIKFDGYRLVAVKKQGELTFFTRSGIDWTDKFSLLADGMSRLSENDFVLDGEAVVFDAKGRSRFGDLQAALQSGDGGVIRYVAFDLLHWNGKSLREQPLTERLAVLKEMMTGAPEVIVSSKVWPSEQGRDLFKQACENGLEGIISKHIKGRYLAGERRDWVKSKCRARQEFVVCGYTEPKGSLEGFGALLLASREQGAWVPRGKVGTGFSAKDRLRLVQVFKNFRTSKRVLKVKESGVTWLKPSLVVEVEFAEITRDGSIRQGSFVAMRDDKVADDVHLDAVATSTGDAKGTVVAGVVITHAERLVYPDDSISKIEVARYYERVGEWMLPYVANRPLALLRAPNGITGPSFFQKTFPNHLPAGVKQTALRDGSTVFFIKDVEGIVSLAQFGAIEFHPWGAPMPEGEKPDVLIWDLDPEAAVPWKEVLGAAFLLRDFLAELGFETVVKTSGGKGLHLVLPIKRSHEWPEMKEFTKQVSRSVADMNPKRFVITSTKAKRSGKIFIDWMRNGRGSTCVAPWSLRARAGAAVSRPVNWADLPEVSPDGFTLGSTLTLPEEWAKIRPQTVPMAVLRKLGVISK